MQQDLLLSIKNIEHAFDQKPILQHIDLSVHQGEILSLLGPSGCGKTTLLRLIAGLEPRQKGEILYHFLDIKDQASPSKTYGKVSMMFQDFALFPHLNVKQNILFGCKKGSAFEQDPFFKEIIREFRLIDYLDVFPHTLSGGQQQRVALARALVTKPALVLLDEPFSGLDTNLRQELRDFTLHWLKAENITTIMVTHDPEEAMFMSDKVAVMNEGRIQQIGSPVSLYKEPYNRFVAEFMGSVNAIKGVGVSSCEIASPLGAVQSDKAIVKGQSYDLLIRPEAIKMFYSQHPLSDDSGYFNAKVVVSRFVGRSTVVHMDVTGPNGDVMHIHARGSGDFQPSEGEQLYLHIDRSLCYIFEG